MKSQINDRGRVKVRLLEVDVEGGSNAILEGIRSVTAALAKDNARTVNGHSPTRILTATATTKHTGSQNGELFPEAVADEPEAAEEPLEEVASDADQSKPKKKTYYPNCKLLTLDLDKGNPNLRDFYAQKAPKTVFEKYMVIAFWLKKELNLAALNYDHMYTCLTAVKVKPQKDIGHPFRDMKNKQFVQNEDSTWSLHSNGEAEVNHLPAKA